MILMIALMTVGAALIAAAILSRLVRVGLRICLGIAGLAAIGVPLLPWLDALLGHIQLG